jgi:hypothetical protein
MYSPFYCSYLCPRKQSVLRSGDRLLYAGAVPVSQWYVVESATKQDACHSSEEAERVCVNLKTPLAVACETKALRIFDLSIVDDPAIDGGRIKLTVRGMNSLKKGKSWRLGWFSEWARRKNLTLFPNSRKTWLISRLMIPLPTNTIFYTGEFISI